MIIVSKTLKNATINFSNNDVEFNSEKKAKVTKELGELITKNFPNEYWEEGKEPKPKASPKLDETNIDNSKLETLKEEITRLKMIISDKDDAIKLAKEGEQTWRDEFQKLQDSVKNGDVTVELKADEDEFLVPEQHKDLYDGMMEKNFLGLKKWVKDSFNKSEEDLEECKSKDDLAKFVFEKCEIEN